MSGITGEFVSLIATIWHRFSLSKAESELLADMLAPMDEAGEDLSGQLEFDMEPSDFMFTLEQLAPESKVP